MRRWLKRGLPKTLTQRQARSLLEQNGWKCTIGGKHNVKMVKEGCRPITLPQHKGQVYPAGLTEAILKEAGLKR